MGFLLKLVLVAAIMGGVVFFVGMKRGTMPNISSLPENIKTAFTQVNTATLWANLSASLDSLVTHPDPNSPVVLGVKITNDSLTTVVDVIRSLPPDQIAQIKTSLCAPTASPSAR